ncbi:MAG: VWA domain-containing protein [Acidimicrobiales bacterium]|nr:VWA domain-containing protein [Acidimicrobiales bacterium]MDP6299556.1 VWA domain-containing protein [Acidimicrobiales bacterium]HJM28052.1 VWA domain-containing protein [Acidimicrobiales bacterium]HJM96601.1 VWA domain-containing protein [Acidimicrobiales bacterium]
MPAPADLYKISTTPELLAQSFVTYLRAMGINVPIAATVVFHEALGAIGVQERNNVYWAGRTTLLSQPSDIPTYDEAFRTFWEGSMKLEIKEDTPTKEFIQVGNEEVELEENSEDRMAQDNVISLKYSPSEILKNKDFALYSEEELNEVYDLMKSIESIGGTRQSRRKITTSKQSVHPNLKKMVRSSFKTGGEPIKRHFIQHGEKTRNVVFLLDISGSMDSYARALLRFIQAAVIGRRRVEAFTLGTRLTRVTKELSNRDLDVALSRASQSIPDWSGGTRIGDSLANFVNNWGQRGMGRGSTIVILSDGWDRGDSEIMTEQMGRLSRLSHQIIWMNPLKASPGYEPLAQGMAAAIPFIDHFIEGHSLESLSDLAELLTE